MGFGKSSQGSSSGYVPTQTASAPDYSGIMGSQTALMESMMAANTANTQALVGSLQNTAPTSVDYTPAVDYASENKTLQQRIDEGIEFDDAKREGVLGTIMTNLDDEDDPSTVGPSLLSGNI